MRGKLKIYNENELAQLLEVEPRTLTVWRTENRGPDYVKLGKQVFYRKEDVREWIARNVVVVNRSR